MMAGAARGEAPPETTADGPDPVTLRYGVDADLIYETMVMVGKRVVKLGADDDTPRSGLRAVLVWLLIMVSLAATIDLLKAAGARTELLWVLFGLVLGLAAYHIYLTRSYRRLARLIAGNPVYGGEIETRLDRHGIEMRSAGAVDWLCWQAVEDVLTMKQGLALVIPSKLAPLPDDALPEGMSRGELLRRINAWRAAAKAHQDAGAAPPEAVSPRLGGQSDVSRGAGAGTRPLTSG